MRLRVDSSSPEKPNVGLLASSLVLWEESEAMGELRDRMVKQMQLRDLSAATHRAYLRAVQELTRYYGRAPDTLSCQEIQDYLLYLVNVRKLAHSTLATVRAALGLFYREVLERTHDCFYLPPCRTPRPLPEVLSHQELQRLFTSTDNLKHQTLLMTTYGAGLRVSEVVRLRANDIDSGRMMLRIEQAKNRRDRYTILAQRLLRQLRIYWRAYRPRTWLFEGQKDGRHICGATAGMVFRMAKRQAGTASAGTLLCRVPNPAQRASMASFGTVLSLSPARLPQLFSLTVGPQRPLCFTAAPSEASFNPHRASSHPCTTAPRLSSNSFIRNASHSG